MHFKYNTLKIEELEQKDTSLSVRKEKEEMFKFLLNKNLAIYISNNNISPTYLAEATGFSVQHFSNMLKYKDLTTYQEVKNNKSLGIFCLYRVLEVLQISIDPLLNFENNKLLERNDDFENKKNFLINKIKNIDDPDIIEKIIYEINFFDKLASKNNNDDLEY